MNHISTLWICENKFSAVMGLRGYMTKNSFYRNRLGLTEKYSANTLICVLLS